MITTNNQQTNCKNRKKDFYEFIKTHKSRLWTKLFRANMGRKRYFYKNKNEKIRMSEKMRKGYIELADVRKNKRLVEKEKINEIVNELEEFEIKYAERLQKRYED